jgi:hypothetical protein
MKELHLAEKSFAIIMPRGFNGQSAMSNGQKKSSPWISEASGLIRQSLFLPPANC